MRLTRLSAFSLVVSLIFVNFAASCSSKQSSPVKSRAEILVTKRLSALAGGTSANVIDCRSTEPDGPRVANPDCAISALAQHRAFFILYYPRGIDSFLLEGFSGDSSGNVYEVGYDSMGFQGGHLAHGQTLTDNGHVLIAPCPKPIALTKTRDNILACRGSD